MHSATIATPPGPFTIVVDGDGAVIASGWTADAGDLLALVRPAPAAASIRVRPELGGVTAAVASYLQGNLAAIDDVPVTQHGGPFIEQAWKVLRTVPAGEPVTYRELAAMAGRPDAFRAAASACARNPTALFVPCHRVVRTGGGLGGFRWGLPVKQWLLDHERG
ncbi:MAG TPA: methylated-DNA--[protein]-cysteine S-methyltransferase [Acidimicrobiales bacterium]|jgi:methylated-DNA-[protein]-cysteine S-methyltransferase